MNYVITATSTIVPITVTLGTVADGMVSIVASTFHREANGNCRLVSRTAILVLTHHRNLLHRTQDIVECLIGMLTMNVVCTFDTQVKWWR